MHTVFPLYKKVFPLNYRWMLDPHVPLWPFFRQYKQGAVTSGILPGALRFISYNGLAPGLTYSYKTP
jgi:hypothetical protein